MEIMKEDSFRKQLKKGLTGGYFFYGEEDYLKSFALRSAREAICPDPTFSLFNDVRIDALDYSPDALLDALIPPPMMADQKIVTLSGINVGSLRADELSPLFDTLGELSRYDHNVLILSIPADGIDVGTAKKPSSLFQKLSEYLTPVHFPAVTGAKLTAWVEKHFAHHGVTASGEVCSFLIGYCGRSMFTLSAETEKISYYVLENGRNTVTREDVEKVSVPELASDTFALANAILDERSEDALGALAVMKFHRVDPIIVLSEVSRVICDMLSYKLLQEDGMSAQEIAALYRKNEYQVRLYLTGASGKSHKKLRRALELCADADLSLKRSPQGYMIIERLICGL